MNVHKLIAKTDYLINGRSFVKHIHKLRGAHSHDTRRRVILRYAKSFIPAIASVADVRPLKNDANEKIFSIWLQGEKNAPALVRACYRSVRAHCAQELVVLDEKTLFEYITLPDFIVAKWRAGEISNAHFADICRVELLYKYGGFWLDATGFVTAPIPDWIVDQDFFVYMAGQNVGSPYSFMQNCFIRARRGAYLLAAWREMIYQYWRDGGGVFDYFVHQLLFLALVTNDMRAKKYFAKMPHVNQDPTHALWCDTTHLGERYDAQKFAEYTVGAFFQKTSYKSPYAENPAPGSVADVMINKMNKN